jgi:HAD superfamily hydrolase (TIGR01458 family)
MRGALIDLDGVIWEADQAVPGAPGTVAWLAAERVPYLFVTNTTSRPRRCIVDKLSALGVSANIEQILTPPVAAGKWLARHCDGPAVLIVPETTREDFKGIQTVDLQGADDVGAVVIGDIGETWTYPLMNEIFRLLMRDPAPPLIALGMTRYWRADDGLRLDVAPFVKAFEHAAGCEAIVLGKPSPDFFAIALGQIGCAAAETLMIGDDLVGDVQGAQAVGLHGMLVRTGKYRPQDMDADIEPDATLDSIADLPGWWANDRTRGA